MDSIEEKKQNSSSEIPKKEISECNQKINKYHIKDLKNILLLIFKELNFNRSKLKIF